MTKLLENIEIETAPNPSVAIIWMHGLGADGNDFVPTAVLSRQLAVIRETLDHAALIMNLPGQPKAIKETLEGLRDADGAVQVAGIFAAVPYCVDLIGGPYIETHDAVCKAFRPKSAQRPAKA